MSYFNKQNGTISTIPDDDITEEITHLVYPIFGYAGEYLGYVDRGLVYRIGCVILAEA